MVKAGDKCMDVSEAGGADSVGRCWGGCVYLVCPLLWVWEAVCTGDMLREQSRHDMASCALKICAGAVKCGESWRGAGLHLYKQNTPRKNGQRF